MTDTIQISPADGWYFVFWDQQKPTAMPIAAWALQKSGAVIGLVGEVEQSGGSKPFTPSLVSVPPVKGSYKHHSSLSSEERVAANVR